jgi:(p)ppGpp synthase/HD superfamily hydrolase
MSVIAKAKLLAEFAHFDQKRKYTGEPYFNHCEEVAWLTAVFGGSDNMVAAAYLHDVVEDTPITNEQINEWFGSDISNLVYWLTDISLPHDGNRAARKLIDRQHTAKASIDAQFIKCADIISNTKSIVEHDPNFARVYLREMQGLLGVMTKVENTDIFVMTKESVINGLKKVFPIEEV